jgi:hypothetical protein
MTNPTLNEQRRIVAYLDSVQVWLASHKGMISLRELRSQTGEGIAPVLWADAATVRAATIGGRSRESCEDGIESLNETRDNQF